MTAARRRYSDPCGIARALDAVGERWALLVVRELLLGPRRFGQLREGLPDISPNVLSQRLRELEDAGVLRRRTLDPPADLSIYELTERGAALEPVLLELGRWGSAAPRVTGRELSPTSMLVALKTMADPRARGRAVYGLTLGGEQYRLAITDGVVDVSREHAADADAAIDTDVGTLRTVVFLGTGVRAAEAAGALRISGDRRAAARLPRYFRRPEPA